MAAPHVTGAFAILKQAAPGAAVTTLLNALQQTGLPITANTRRIQVKDALAAVGGSPSVFSLSVVRRGSGTGTVTSADGQISCGSACSATFNSGTSVTLTTFAGSGSTFKQWGGACSGTGTTCALAMNATQSVTATFSENFTDGSGPNGTIAPGGTVIKAVHVLELRTAIANLRALNGFGAFSWTDPTLTVQSTVARGAHVLDLRTALSSVCSAVPGACVGYTDPTLTTGQTVIKAAHLNELRANVRALE